MKFLMASKGRSETIHKCLDFIGRKDMVVLVDEIEREAYEKVIKPPAELMFHPSLYGMGKILKFGTMSLLHEDYIVVVDDDYTGMMHKYHPGMKRFFDSEHFRAVVENTYQMADDLGTPLAGWANNASKFALTQLQPFEFSGYAASLKLIIPRHLGDVMWDDGMVIRDEQDLALQVKYHKRFVLLDQRYATLDNVWTMEGGASTLRHDGVYKADNSRMIRKWGKDVIKVNPKKPKQILIHWQF